MSENIEKAPNVPPFVSFVTSTVPMVFDNSLSYYEALSALWKWLQDDIVDVINNNATVTQDYINLTNELKSFVENYFNNLDVQEEINNKLDAMAEDGTLQEIITAYIQANVAWTFDTVTDMQAATNLVAGSYARTLGFHSLNDGGDGLYYITDTGTANGMNVIAIDDLYANLVIGNKVNAKQFGAYGDGVHDDTSVLQYCIDYANSAHLGVLYIPTGEYILSDTLTITHTTNIYGEYDKFYGTYIRQTGVNKGIFSYITNDNYGSRIANIRMRGDGTTIGINTAVLLSEFYIEKVNFYGQFDTCLRLTNADIGDIRDCVISGSGIGIDLIQCTEVNVDNCNLWNNDVDMKVTQISTCHFTNNWFESTNDDSVGILFQAPSRVLYSSFDNNTIQKRYYCLTFDGATNVTDSMYFQGLSFSNSRFSGKQSVTVDYVDENGTRNTNASNTYNVTFDNCLFNNVTAGQAITTDYGGLRWRLNNCVAFSNWTYGDIPFINRIEGDNRNFVIINNNVNGYETNGMLTLNPITDINIAARKNNSFYINTANQLRFRDNSGTALGFQYLRSGNTASRPQSRQTGDMYLDLSLMKPIWWNGNQWIDATGTPV